ncbi:hypothetical protein BS47DRAFT_1450782 [Hydnum rufescens UP504]|uniref:DnaJ homolog 1, mitochondrial n=1 Tax=Hydnum rufescens UP504 TaxID=1448309 RepID=A0A9P6DXP6_9AGAM|nr:hypothetical protein BS47DRAFT_1450782 [Hydnum rufescens UP504]
MPPRIPSHLSLYLISNSCSRTSSVASSSRCTSVCLSKESKRLLSTATVPRARKRGLFKGCRCPDELPVKKRNFHSSSPSSASAKDPYEVLGVPRSATASEIKKKYYELARKHHPDTNKEPSSKDRFVEIQAAWDTLGDEKKRAAYDQYGSASQQAGFDPNAFAGRGPFGAGGFGGFQDFAQAFGGNPRGQADLFETIFGSCVWGEDLESSLNLSFVDACKGATRTVNVTPIVDCHTCAGTGLKKGSQLSTCGTCGGTGTRTFVIDSGFQMASTCNTCHGTGTVVPKGAHCGSCDGMGKVKERKTVEVKVPSGVEDGMTIHAPVSGRGTPGDLLVRVNVAPSKLFRRQGTNLYHETRIPLHTALLGGKVRVPTLDGDVDVKVPSGTQPGEEAVLKGRGVPNVFGGSKGDLYVMFGVQLPRTLTPRQREILQQFADEIEGRAARPKAETKGTSSTAPPKPPPVNDLNESKSTMADDTSSSGGGGEGFFGWLGKLKDAALGRR